MATEKIYECKDCGKKFRGGEKELKDMVNKHNDETQHMRYTEIKDE